MPLNQHNITEYLFIDEKLRQNYAALGQYVYNALRQAEREPDIREILLDSIKEEDEKYKNEIARLQQELKDVASQEPPADDDNPFGINLEGLQLGSKKK